MIFLEELQEFMLLILIICKKVDIFKIIYKVPTKQQGYTWIIEYERQAIWKNNHSGWTYVSDSMSKRNLHFTTLEKAISYCTTNGR